MFHNSYFRIKFLYENLPSVFYTERGEPVHREIIISELSGVYLDDYGLTLFKPHSNTLEAFFQLGFDLFLGLGYDGFKCKDLGREVCVVFSSEQNVGLINVVK